MKTYITAELSIVSIKKNDVIATSLELDYETYSDDINDIGAPGRRDYNIFYEGY